MIAFANGHNYKLVYLDTNVINEISKNTNFFGKNFMEKYLDGSYGFATSVFNLYELSRTHGESRKKIINFFDLFPLAVLETYPRLAEIEKTSNVFSKEMVMFTLGAKMMGFNIQLGMLFEEMDRNINFRKTIEVMNSTFVNEMEVWKQHQRGGMFGWMKEFKKNLLLSMNESFLTTEVGFEIDVLGKYKSVELYSFIKNQFIYTSQKEVNQNSIIDAYNAAIAPYVEVYITERTVGSWLEMAKKKFKYLSNLEVVKLSDLYEKII